MKPAPKLSDLQKTELNDFLTHKKTKPAELLRCQAILMLNDGIDIPIITKYTSLKRSQIYDLRKNYLINGINSLKTKPREKEGKLTKNQLALIIETLKTKSPRDFSLNGDCWSAKLLAYLIKEQFGVKYKSLTSIYTIFKKSGLSFHKPGQVYQKRNQAVVNTWIKDVLPVIEKAIEDKDTVVLASDEMILRTQTTFKKIWLPRNHYPKIKVSNERKRIAIYGFLELGSGVQHAYPAERCATEETVEILKNVFSKLKKNQKILLLWDNAPWHKSIDVKALLASFDGRLQVINFPPYAPDLNPQERVWKAARANVTHNKYIGNIKQAAADVVNYLNNTLFDYKISSSSPVL